MIHSTRRTLFDVLFAIGGLMALVGALASAGGATAAEKPKPGETITNKLGMKLVLIPDGEFTMGSHESKAKLEQAFGRLPPQAVGDRIAAEHPAES
ncbi:MAG TPA: hypothetical protein VMV69_27870 [Pirellulales bacterium]|nr:hypothetical protein [Pirellulales bacterium]